MSDGRTPIANVENDDNNWHKRPGEIVNDSLNADLSLLSVPLSSSEESFGLVGRGFVGQGAATTVVQRVEGQNAFQGHRFTDNKEIIRVRKNGFSVIFRTYMTYLTNFMTFKV